MSLSRILIEFTQRQLQYMKQYGAEIIDWLQTDDYEIMLFKDKQLNQALGIPFQIGFQRKGKDFSNPEDYLSKHIPDNVSVTDLRKVSDKIEEWLQEYSPIGVGSNDPEKSRKYKSIFKRLGFKVREEKWQDQSVIILEK